MAASVLIVEDERIVARDLQQTLRGMGYDAFAIARSADEALAHAAERRPGLALVDIRIEGELDGTATAALLRERYDVPIVFLTAHADDETIARAKQSDPYGYLVKPVKHTELKTAIEISLHRHVAERELRARERWFFTTLQSITDAVVTTDIEGRVSFMNPTAEALTGMPLDQARGRPVGEVVRMRAQGEARVPIDEAIAKRTPVEIVEAELEQASSTHRIVSDGAAPVVDRDVLLGAVMTFHDVTERRLVQRRLEQSERLAALGTMAATVGHEINNPLTVVAANAAYLRDELSRLLRELRTGTVPTGHDLEQLEELLEATMETQSSATQITRIVEDLSAFARPRRTASERADVERAIQWAVRLTSHELRLRAGVVIDAAGLPPVTLEENKLGQVLINLLLNAAQAIAPGNVSNHRVTISARVAGPGQMVIEVRDTGCGMSREIAGSIFERFFTTKTSGTGLGLAVCREIVASAGGEISVDSELGAGSVFRFTLPIAGTVDSVPPADKHTVGPFRRGRILVIDDEELVALAIKRILDDHVVVTATSGKAALELIARGEDFDVIFSDLGMPNMTGVELFEALRTVSPELSRRVVFLTGGATTAVAVEFLTSLRNMRLHKPRDLDRLPGIVQELLAEQQRR